LDLFPVEFYLFCFALFILFGLGCCGILFLKGDLRSSMTLLYLLGDGLDDIYFLFPLPDPNFYALVGVARRYCGLSRYFAF